MNSDQNDIISIISGSYLDSPTTDILYYTLYWKIKIGSSGSVSGNINLNKVETETETYEPRPISSLPHKKYGIQEPLTIPSVIYQNGSNAGIGITAPVSRITRI